MSPQLFEIQRGLLSLSHCISQTSLRKLIFAVNCDQHREPQLAKEARKSDCRALDPEWEQLSHTLFFLCLRDHCRWRDRRHWSQSRWMTTRKQCFSDRNEFTATVTVKKAWPSWSHINYLHVYPYTPFSLCLGTWLWRFHSGKGETGIRESSLATGLWE